MSETNPTLSLLLSHTSVRDYEDREVPETVRAQIIDAARHASTSCFFQVTTVIRVSDKEKRRQISEITHQQHVLKAPEMWIFCADLSRIKTVYPQAKTGWMEQFLVGCQDTGIFAQNAMIALESLGLGGVYAGAIRNDLVKINAILELPDEVFPVVGICFGYPAKKNEVKPRMPADVLLMDNVYHRPEAAKLAAYDQVTADYFAHRGANAKDSCWSAEIERLFSREQRAYLKDYLQSKGWCQR